MPDADQKWFSRIRHAAAEDSEVDYVQEYDAEEYDYMEEEEEPEPEPEPAKVVRKGPAPKGAARVVLVDNPDCEVVCSANRCSMMASSFTCFLWQQVGKSYDRQRD